MNIVLIFIGGDGDVMLMRCWCSHQSVLIFPSDFDSWQFCLLFFVRRAWVGVWVTSRLLSL